jgi:hypothetical protein
VAGYSTSSSIVIIIVQAPPGLSRPPPRESSLLLVVLNPRGSITKPNGCSSHPERHAPAATEINGKMSSHWPVTPAHCGHRAFEFETIYFLRLVVVIVHYLWPLLRYSFCWCFDLCGVNLEFPREFPVSSSVHRRRCCSSHHCHDMPRATMRTFKMS